MARFVSTNYTFTYTQEEKEAMCIAIEKLRKSVGLAVTTWIETAYELKSNDYNKIKEKVEAVLFAGLRNDVYWDDVADRARHHTLQARNFCEAFLALG